MTRVAVIALGLVVAFGAISTYAKADVIALYGDDSHTTCSAQEIASFALVFYVFHYSATGATGSRFTTPFPPCFVDVSGPFMNVLFPNTVGQVGSGVQVDYGGCLTGWIHVIDVVYSSTFNFPACCEQTMTTHPAAASGHVEVFNCSGEAVPVIGYSGISNGNETCLCEEPVGAGSTTWGSIKALYVSE